MNKVDWTKVDCDKFRAALMDRISELNKIAPGVVVEVGDEANEPFMLNGERVWGSTDAALFTVCVRLSNVSVSLSSQKPDWIVVHGDCSIDELSRAQSVIASVDKLASECLKKPKHPFIGRSVKGTDVTHVTEKWGLELPELNSRARPPIGACWARTPAGELGLLSEVNGLLVFRAVVGTEKEISLYQTLSNEFYTRPRNNHGVMTIRGSFGLNGPV